MRIPKIVVIVSFVSITALAVVTTLFVNNRKSVPIPEIAGFVYPEAKPLLAFNLVNDANESVGPEWFNGKWSFLFFGYTYCPDICPLTMTTLDKAYNQLNEEGIIDNARVVFLSVDPQRDKPERLAEYMRYFNAAFHGATGSEQQLENITRQLSVVYIPPKPEDGETDYIVDHSSSIILIDPDASAHAVFSAPHSPENIVDGFRKIINRWQQLYTS